MKVVIVEDEVNAQEALKKMLQLIAPQLEISGIFETVKAAIHFLNNNSIDMLFLDIRLEDGTGFDVLQELENQHFALIFTTAYDEYAIKAFKFSAIDYLLKPIEPLELQQAIARATKRGQEQITPVEPAKKDQKIVLKTTENRYVLEVNDILYLEAEGSYTTFHTATKTIMVSKHLKYYEDLLQDYGFIRSHQSFLVAQSHIKEIRTSRLILSNESEVPISHRKKKLINDRL